MARRRMWNVPAAMVDKALRRADEFMDSEKVSRQRCGMNFTKACMAADLKAEKLDLERAKLAPPVQEDARDVWTDILDEIRAEGDPGVV
jgi:hypothetical protein